MTRTPAQALDWANKVTAGYAGLCLKYVREAYGVAAKYPSAIAAWNGAKRRHGSLANAPVGAPVYFSHPKSVYGHVALLGADRTTIRTTHSTIGHPVTQPISTWTGAYGYTLLGWAEDVNGVHVASPLAPTPAKPPAPSRPKPSGPKNYYSRGDTGNGVRELQRVLNAWYPRLQPLAVDGSYGPATEARVRYFQKRARLVVDGLAGPKTLHRLGMTYKG